MRAVLQVHADGTVAQVRGELAGPVVVQPGRQQVVEEGVGGRVGHAGDVMSDHRAEGGQPGPNLGVGARGPVEQVSTTQAGRPCQCSLTNGSGGARVIPRIAPSSSGASAISRR